MKWVNERPVLSTEQVLDRRVLDHAYSPNNPAVIPNALAEIEADLFKKNKDVYLWAKQGVGKSFLARQLIKAHPNQTVYLQCSFSLPETVAEFLNITSPYFGSRLGVLTGSFCKNVKANFKKPVLFIFDDLQQLRRFKDFILFCGQVDRSMDKDDMEARFLLISQRPYEKMMEGTKKWEPKEGLQSRLQPDIIAMKPYDPSQLTQIFQERVRIASQGRKLNYDNGGLIQIAAITFRLGSDIRLGLRLLHDWLDTDRTDDDVEKVWGAEKKRYWYDQIISMHPHQAALLYSIAQTEGHIAVPKLYEDYAKFLKGNLRSPLAYPWVHQLLDNLVLDGFIEREQTTTRGRPFKVWLHSSIPRENIIPVCEKIDWVKFLR